MSFVSHHMVTWTPNGRPSSGIHICLLCVTVAQKFCMMTSSMETFFRVTGHLCWEFTGHRRGLTQRRVNNRGPCDLKCHRAHFDVTVICIYCVLFFPSQITIVNSVVCSAADQREHRSSASLAFVRGIHRGPVNFPHKWQVTRKRFPFDDVIKTFPTVIIPW